MSGGRRFKIEVTAVDAATPVIGKVNKAIGDLQKPAAQTDAGLRRIADSASLGNLSKELTKIGRGAQDAVGWVGELIPQFSTIAGIGSAVGFAAFTSQWMSNAANIGRAAQAIGQSATQLQIWQSVARSAGLTSEDLNSGMENLAGSLQDAVAGRNQEIQAAMAQLGIRLRLTKDGAIDTTEALNDLSAAFDRTRSGGKIVVNGIEMSGLEGAKNLAKVFGVGNLIPLLLLGQEKIKKFQDQARQSGGIINDEDTARAIEYEQSLVRVGNAASGTANRLGSILTPAITKTNDAIANGLININRLLEAAEKLPAKHTIGNPAFRSAALSVGGVNPNSPNSYFLKWLGAAGDLGTSMGTDLGNWLMGNKKPTAPPAGTPYSSANSDWANQKRIADMTPEEFAAIGRANRVAVSGPDGTVVIKLHVDTAPGLRTRTVAEQNTTSGVKVETFMPTDGP